MLMHEKGSGLPLDNATKEENQLVSFGVAGWEANWATIYIVSLVVGLLGVEFLQRLLNVFNGNKRSSDIHRNKSV